LFDRCTDHSAHPTKLDNSNFNATRIIWCFERQSGIGKMRGSIILTKYVFMIKW
jgi:hypothetical protein